MAKSFKGIEILLENEELVVINKPAGISVHSDGKTKEYTISDYAEKKLHIDRTVGESILLDSGEEITRAGIVHRLDKETTGALIIAKNDEVFSFLKGQFQNRKVKKVYLAFVRGVPRDERGIINKPIGRASKDIRKWATSNVRGELREAITRYRVVAKKDGVSLLVLWPETGRTHQIRVHLASLGHPVLADYLYGTLENVLGFKRQALHSYKISFRSPVLGEVKIKASLPEDFQAAFKKVDFDEKNLPI